MAAPFALTYRPPSAPLPDWLTVYSVEPTLTTTVQYTINTVDQNGLQTAITGEVVQTFESTILAQLPITVDVTYDVGEGVYTVARGTGPTVISIIGVTGTAALVTVEPSSATAATSSPLVGSLPTSGTAPADSASSSPIATPSNSATSTLPVSSTAFSSEANAPTRSSSTASPSSAAGASSTASSGLSTGVISGIVLGCIALFFLALVCVACVARRRRKDRTERHSHEWDFVPVAQRRGSEGTSNKSFWHISAIVGLVKKRGSASTDSRWGSAAEKSPLTDDHHREQAARNETLEDMPMMSERAAPADVFPTRANSPVVQRYGATAAGTLASATITSPRRASEPSAAPAEHSPLLGAEDDAVSENRSMPRTPEMPSGLAGAAAATGLLYSVEDFWSGTPQSRLSGSPVKRSRNDYSPYRMSGTSTPPEQLDRRPSQRRKPTQALSEFAWLRGRTSDLAGTASSSRTGTGTGNSVGNSSGSGSRGFTRSGYDTGSYQSAQASLHVPEGVRSRETSANDNSPNMSELFHTTPRWLGGVPPSLGQPLRSSVSPSLYPDEPPDPPEPSDYPYATGLPFGTPKRLRPARNDIEDQSLQLPRIRKRDSEGLLERIAKSFSASFGLAGLGVGMSERSRESSHYGYDSASNRDSYASVDRQTFPAPALAVTNPSTPERGVPLRRSFASATFGGDYDPPPSPTRSIARSTRSQRRYGVIEPYEQDETLSDEITPRRNKMPNIRNLRSVTATSNSDQPFTFENEAEGSPSLSEAPSSGPSQLEITLSSGSASHSHAYEHSSLASPPSSPQARRDRRDTTGYARERTRSATISDTARQTAHRTESASLKSESASLSGGSAESAGIGTGRAL